MALLSNLPYWVRRFDPSTLDFDPAQYAEYLNGFSQSTETYNWNQTTSRLVGHIPFEQTYSFLLWAMGISYIDSNGVLRRELPCMHPRWSNKYCVSVQLAGVGPDVVDPKEPKTDAPEGRKQFPFSARYQKQQITLDFAPPPPGVNYFTDAELGIFTTTSSFYGLLLTGGWNSASDVILNSDVAWQFETGTVVDLSWTGSNGVSAGRVGMTVANVATSPAHTIRVTGGEGIDIPNEPGLTFVLTGVADTVIPQRSEANRFVFIDRQPFSEVISVPEGSVVIDTDSITTVNIGGETFIPIRQAKMKLKWYRVPIDYIRRASDGTYPLLEAAIGTINSTSFLGYPPGTLLVDSGGPVITPISIPVQRENGLSPQIPWMADVEIPLLWRNPFNGYFNAGVPSDPKNFIQGHLLRPAPYGDGNTVGKWYPARYKGGSRPLIESTDFYDMFKGLQQMGLS